MSYDDRYAIDYDESEFFNRIIKPLITDDVENLASVDGRIGLDSENINLNHGDIRLAEGSIILEQGNISLMQGQLLVQSDERLKTDIRPIENALERVDKLKGVYYHWKDDDKKEKLEIGVIAQDVQKQFPELVNTDKNSILSVDYVKLTAILIECVKDLKQQISYLKKHS
jgi:hypothetical protein